MTDSSSRIFQLSDTDLDPEIVTTLRVVHKILSELEIPYFLMGATARDLLLRNVFGLSSGRLTKDVDFAVAAKDWNEFAEVNASLVESGQFQAVPKSIHRLKGTEQGSSVLIDIVPFGGLERANSEILWPPDYDIVMNVAGFTDALNTAIQVQLDEQHTIPVVTLECLIVLKLFAWKDRNAKNNKDAADIYTLLKEYAAAGNTDRIFEDHLPLLEHFEFDLELTGAALLGFDTARILTLNTREAVEVLLNAEDLMDRLAGHMMQSLSRMDDQDDQKLKKLLSAYRYGFGT